MNRSLWMLCFALTLSLLTIAACRRGDVVTRDVTWTEQSLVHEDAQISVGYVGLPPAGRPLEPAVAVTRGGKPDAGAMVFVTLLPPSGEPTINDEHPALYIPDGAEGFYAGASLDVPAPAKSCTVRYRVVLPQHEGEWTHDVEYSLRPTP